MKYINTLIQFIKHNRLLVVLLVIFVFIIILLIFNLPNSLKEQPQTPDATWYQTTDFTIYVDKNGNISVETRNPLATDPAIIKKTLGIPDNKEISVIFPRLANTNITPVISNSPTMMPSITLDPKIGD